MAGVRSKPRSSGCYVGWYSDENGRQKFFTGTRRKAETRQMAERLEDERRQIRLKYRPAPKGAERYGQRPFAETRDEYLEWGNAQGGRGGRPWGRTHARQRKTYLKWWGETLALETLADLEGILPKVEEALRALQADGLAGKTLANRAEALRSLCRWCVQRGYLSENPLRAMRPFDVTPRTTRRAMTRGEIAKLLEVASEDRRLLYEVAFTSGLRAGELRALSVADLDVERGGLRLHAEWTKNRKAGFQPLPAALVERLKVFAASGQPKALCARFYARRDARAEGVAEEPLLFVPSHAGREMEKDLKKAEVPKKAFGGKIDFHACRVAYISFVVEAGANVKEAQSLARHVTPGLTLNTYARAREERLTSLTESVGELVGIGADYAHSRTLAAAGAEGLDVSAVDAKTLGEKRNGGGGGNRTRWAKRTCGNRRATQALQNRHKAEQIQGLAANRLTVPLTSPLHFRN